MLASVLSFLGGSAFRMIWGEISSWLTRQQDHTHELARMRLEALLAQEQHARVMESVRLQAELGIKVVEARAAAEVGQAEAEAWGDAVRSTGKPVGVAWVDAWNAAIRPGGATWALLMLTLDAFAVANVGDSAEQVCFAFLGVFVADRTLGKRGK